MAGYLFTFKEPEYLFESIETGTYSPLMALKWSGAAAATLADFITMKPGDNVYLFSKRMVYGIGEIVDIIDGICVAENHPKVTRKGGFVFNAKTPSLLKSGLETSSDHKKVQRWRILFKPSPKFFTQGVDMDDLLLSNTHAFRSLRVFWKRSFIKLDDEENAAFKAALLRKNIDHLDDDEQFACNYEATQHQMLSSKLTIEKPDIEGLILQDRNENGFLNSEMILELGLLHQLTRSEFSATQAFGKWDYLSHQIAASPMKAVDYMDRADVFGYTWISGYDNAFIEKYLVCELKKGKINPDEDIRQLMKYVDWVCDEYANGDYSQIEAFLVGSKIGNYDIEALLQLVLRSHLSGHRPPSNEIWNSVSLVTYQAVDSGKLEFERVVDFASVPL